MKGRLFFCVSILTLVSSCTMRYGSLTRRNQYRPEIATHKEKRNEKINAPEPLRVEQPAVLASDSVNSLYEVQSGVSGNGDAKHAEHRETEVKLLNNFTSRTALQDSVDKKLTPNRNATRSLRFSIAGLILGALLAAGVLIYVSSAAFVSGVTSAVSTAFFLVFFGGVNGVIIIALLAVSWGVKALIEMRKESESAAGLINPSRRKAIWGLVLGILLFSIIILIGALV